jgi:hypothetical protein
VALTGIGTAFLILYPLTVHQRTARIAGGFENMRYLAAAKVGRVSHLMTFAEPKGSEVGGFAKA